MDSNYIITSSGTFVNTDELYHWGIKGMKWGQRRYQNPDGSLTPAGRKRYTDSDGNLNEKGKKYYAKEAERLKAEKTKLGNQKRTAAKLSKLDQMRKENAELNAQLNGDSTKKNSKLFGKKKRNADDQSAKKSVKDMTDAELDAAINRARKEDEYNRLRPQVTADIKVSSLKKFLNDSVAPAAAKASKDLVAGMMDKAVKDLLKDKVDPNSYDAMKETYDKLKLELDTIDVKNKLNDRKNGKGEEKELTWDEKLKKQQWEKNERDRAEKENKAADNNAGQSKQENKQTQKQSEKQNKQENKQSQKQPKTESPDDYEKRVDSMLAKIDKQGWDTYNKEYGSGGTSNKASSKNSSNSSATRKDYEREVDTLLAEIDENGWWAYEREYGGK